MLSSVRSQFSHFLLEKLNVKTLKTLKKSKKFEFCHETYYVSDEDEQPYYGAYGHGSYDRATYYGRVLENSYEELNARLNEQISSRINEGWEVVGFRYIAKTEGIKIFLRREFSK